VLHTDPAYLTHELLRVAALFLNESKVVVFGLGAYSVETLRALATSVPVSLQHPNLRLGVDGLDDLAGVDAVVLDLPRASEPVRKQVDLKTWILDSWSVSVVMGRVL